MRMAGFEALVVKGCAERPTVISVVDSKVRLLVASPLMGSTTHEAERYLRGLGVPGLQSVVVIGPAGERMVFFAAANVDRYNFFGRLGMGAVMGAKNLKAISVAGTGQLTVPDPARYKEVYERVYELVARTDKLSKYHHVGTPVNVLALNALKALPTKNFQSTTFDRAEGVSGELIAEELLERKVSCAGCPIGCLHVAKLRPAFQAGYEYAPIDVYYNYESIYALGSNLMVGDAVEVLKLIHRANALGVDTMLLGTALAWLTEAYERGLVSEAETDGVRPRWGDAGAYMEALERIVSMPNELYAALAQGPERAAEAYGGRGFCLTIAGNGMAGYHTGYANVLGVLVGARHSHNSNAGYSVDQEALKDGLSPEEVVSKLIKEDEWRYVLTSLAVCMFSRGVYTEEVVEECLKAVGIERSVEDLHSIGREVYHTAHAFKRREGFDLMKVEVPGRLFETPTPHGRLKREVLEAMLKDYARRRGWL